MQIIRAPCIHVDIKLILRLRGLTDSQHKYWPVKVKVLCPFSGRFDTRPALTRSISVGLRLLAYHILAFKADFWLKQYSDVYQ